MRCFFSLFLFHPTDASPVTILDCQGPNTKNAQIILSCSTPHGQYTGFQMTVNGRNITNNSCNYTISGLNHYTNYNVTVITLSYGNPSIPVYYKCLTGITGKAFHNVEYISVVMYFRTRV